VFFLGIGLNEELQDYTKVPDLVVFDVDGVLVDTSKSFRKTVVETVITYLRVTEICSESLSLDLTDIAAFKLINGFNDDIDLSFTLIGLSAVARKYGYQVLARQVASLGGGINAARSIDGWYEPDRGLVFDIFAELYWGTDKFTKLYGKTPRLGNVGPGNYVNETLLAPKDLFARLKSMGVKHFGIVTGRNKFELEHFLKLFSEVQYVQPINIVTSEIRKKPDPECLEIIIRNCGDVRFLAYVGDAMDDLGLAQRYARENPDKVVIPIMVAAGENGIYFASKGVTHIVPSVACLVDIFRG